jgi:hypothetical protein
MPERPNGAVLKTVVRKHRGFESHSLRSWSDAIYGIRRPELDDVQSAASPRDFGGSPRCDVETVRYRVELVAEKMAVEVEGHRRGRMSEHRLHALHRRARSDRERRRGVPQFVRYEHVHADRAGRPVEPAAPEVIHSEHTAARSREHERGPLTGASGPLLAELRGLRSDVAHLQPSISAQQVNHFDASAPTLTDLEFANRHFVYQLTRSGRR